MSHFQIFTPKELESLRRGGRILRECLQFVATLVRPGITTGELDREAEDFIRSQGGAPAFQGYQGYPATLCLSVNDECVHGIPGKRVLQEGDIIAIDGGVLVDGLYTDACISVGVGTIDPERQRLLEVTKRALDCAVGLVREGAHIGDLSAIVQSTVEEAGFVPVRSLTGHGLGRTLHQFPEIPNSGRAGTGPKMPRGTLLAIEPIVSMGSADIVEANDGWTLSIADGAPSAHFEHTVFVTEHGCEVIA